MSLLFHFLFLTSLFFWRSHRHYRYYGCCCCCCCCCCFVPATLLVLVLLCPFLSVYDKIFIDFQQVVSYQKHVSNGHYIIKIIGLVFRSLIQFQRKATFGGARDMTCDMCVLSSDQRPLKISILRRSFDVEPWRDVRVLLPFGISILMLRYSNAGFKDFQKKV